MTLTSQVKQMALEKNKTNGIKKIIIVRKNNYTLTFLIESYNMSELVLSSFPVSSHTDTVADNDLSKKRHLRRRHGYTVVAMAAGPFSYRFR